jgi:hypothetical protein
VRDRYIRVIEQVAGKEHRDAVDYSRNTEESSDPARIAWGFPIQYCDSNTVYSKNLVLVESASVDTRYCSGPDYEESEGNESKQKIAPGAKSLTYLFSVLL